MSCQVLDHLLQFAFLAGIDEERDMYRIQPMDRLSHAASHAGPFMASSKVRASCSRLAVTA